MQQSSSSSQQSLNGRPALRPRSVPTDQHTVRITLTQQSSRTTHFTYSCVLGAAHAGKKAGCKICGGVRTRAQVSQAPLDLASVPQ